MKSNFEEKREARLAAYQRLAAKNEALSNDLYVRAKTMASVIPFGQPILVGHHSEGRDRNYRNRIHNTFGKAFEASDKANHYRDKAASMEQNYSISSDDPNAIDRLREKLESLEKAQSLYKNINKIIRKNASDAEKIYLLVGLGLKENTANELLLPDYCGRIGIPSFKLTNNNANIARIRQRIEHLQKIESMDSSEKTINGVRMVINQEDNRVQLFFPGKPSEEVRKKLKSNGFRWAPSVGAWMRQISNAAIYYAESILNNL